MPRRKPKMTFHSLGVVQRLKEAIRIESSFDYVGLKHRVPIRPADGGLPMSMTLHPAGSDWASAFVAVHGVTASRSTVASEARK